MSYEGLGMNPPALGRSRQTCKHCGLRIEKRPAKSADWLHAEGAQQGKHTCALSPYGFHAEPMSAPCGDHPANPCNGSHKLT